MAAGGGDATTLSPLPDGFWEHWGDGQAELSGYQLVTPRYGASREGYAVLIFVTETFTEAQRVKSDGGHRDEFPVMKLNEIRHFQTGIYDYDLLTSTFVPLDGRAPIGVPTKVSFASQEWCGNLYDQLVVNGNSAHHTRHSYFDGEADLDETEALEDGLFADALPIAVRGLTGELVAPGASLSTRVLPTLASTRLSHEAAHWSDATLTRDAGVHDVTVPAGTFAVASYMLTRPDGTTTWDVEAAAPHRIIGWRGSDGEIAQLTGSIRSKYWEQHGPGDESNLTTLGLPAR